ncbi:MAG: acetate--CoA ligase family protein [Chloroflexi bacterium]|nr:acetate--CoA ligase family protein [Chloroflexota bacterium]
MKVLEFEAKALLRGQGLPIPQGEIVTSAPAAAAAAEAIGQPVVVKVQTPAGGRMKAGGVHFADTPEEAARVTRDLLGSQSHGFSVDRVLVEEKLTVAAEIFIGATYDSLARTGVLLASTTGGIEVESSTGIVRRPFSLLLPVSDYIGREVAAELGFGGSQLLGLANVITKVARCFVQWDALLLELNPVILDSVGRWWVADAHLELDSETSYRQGDLLARLPVSAQMADQRSDFERQAAEIDNVDHRGVAGRLIPLDGNLGLLIGGGGASLTILDAMLDAGLKPANYCEIGGNPSVWKIKELTKLILNQPQVDRIAVIMNVVSNTRVDLVARGVIKGLLELGLDPREAIMVFRIPGSWELEGQAILRHYQVRFFGRETSIDQVVEAIR